MLILVYGIPKSGELFIYQILWDLLESAGFQQESIRRESLRTVPGASKGGLILTNKTSLQSLYTKTTAYPIVLARTHDALSESLMEDISAGKVKIIVANRDSLACAGAMLRHAQNEHIVGDPDYASLASYKNLARCNIIISDFTEKFKSWIPLTEKLIVNHKDLVDKIEDVIESLAKHIGLEHLAPTIAHKYRSFLIEAKELRRSVLCNRKIEIDCELPIYSGLVSGTGEIQIVEDVGPEKHIVIRSNYRPQETKTPTPSEILVSGHRLGINRQWTESNGSLTIQAIAQKFSEKKFGLLTIQPGTLVNLELPTFFGDDVGGQYVIGNIAGVGIVESIDRSPSMLKVGIKFQFKPNLSLSEFYSIIIDGIALTIANINPNQTMIFNIKYHTILKTTVSQWHVGRTVSIELEAVRQRRIPPRWNGK
jgi:riboflavin synthase alpha subunit